MAEAVVENEACFKCGAQVREGTTFCYACGGRVGIVEPESQEDEKSPDDTETKAALDDLAEKMRSAEKPERADEKLAHAAIERKKARVSKRKSREFVWEPESEIPQGLLIAMAMAFVLAVFAVVVTVVWK